MNKKFSTLLLGALLAGAFTTANAERVTTQEQFEALIKNGVLTLPAGDLELVFSGKTEFEVPYFAHAGTAGGEYFIVNTPNVTIKGEEGTVLTGRMVLTSENVTVSGLTIVNKGVANKDVNDATFFCNTTAISVLANSATITDNVFQAGEPEEEQCLQAIKLIPKNSDVEYSISKNKFEGFDLIVGGDPSYAVSVDLENALTDYEMGYLGGIISKYTSASSTDFDASKFLKDNNTFEGCAFDYATILNPRGDYDGHGLFYKTVQIEPLSGDQNAEAIRKVVEQAASEDATIIFKGTVKELQKALGDNFTTEANVAIQCDGANVLYGNVENPDNGNDPVILDAEKLVEIDKQAVLAKNNGAYNVLVVRAEGKNYVIYAKADGSTAYEELTDKLADIKAEGYLWKMTENKDPKGNIYYSFESQLKNGDEAIVLTTDDNNGMFYPANGVAYDNGVVFGFNGTKYYFGLYEAGMNPLYVSNLNYFEKDGFSVTIKYEDKDGKFTKEDIAGNEFVGHLTPMKWDGDKFVEAPATEEEFYLKNADGEYIVAELKADHETEQVYTFTTVSEETLEHQVARGGDEQTYFGEFKAYTSASNQTALTELKAIDKLVVLVDGDAEKEIGRWDYEKTPTLAASTTTALKEILISLGSDKIVDKTKFLQKGKFYTVECVASTNENAKRIGKKLVAGALNDDNEGTWVESYGNVLEGQFALTAPGDYYIFKNRESGKQVWTVPVNALYKTDKDNEYRYKNFTYKIDTVAGHKASDGYKTLPDVKNNKFYIGYASGVFDGNAWFVENHEGDKNHVIGLSTAQDDALIFTAKEYSAARQLKVEDKETHNYTYVPTDSIYVISELGYFNDDKEHKTTSDTLKLVSYTFVNQYTEPLMYNDGQENRLESDVYAKDAKKKRFENVEEAHKALTTQHFALRIDGTKLNLRMVELTNEKPLSELEYKNQEDGERMFQTLDGEYKLSAGDTGDGIVTKTEYLNREENDLFVVEETEKPMYRTVINPLDTISIFRDDNSQSVLFEHNTFLGMENLSQYPEIAKAMIADTAYVRNNTYRPQYMLVVDADITPAGKWCEEHQSADCAHAVPVNLVDTAIAWDAANKHKDNNPYINSEKYYRLGFVQAKHINDSLVIASTNDTLYVGSEDYNQAKFAFRYVDQEAGSFVIETANYNRLPGVEEAEINEDAPLGYLKWMNGVVVVVDDINNADVYNMNENETDTPTANEDIAVEEGVEVIAGNGAVTIQGAAGKTVVITNIILGKAVANTTLTSDNQTINVPAGIVVVTVDGEAVKAIVK